MYKECEINKLDTLRLETLSQPNSYRRVTAIKHSAKCKKALEIFKRWLSHDDRSLAVIV